MSRSYPTPMASYPPNNQFQPPNAGNQQQFQQPPNNQYPPPNQFPQSNNANTAPAGYQPTQSQQYPAPNRGYVPSATPSATPSSSFQAPQQFAQQNPSSTTLPPQRTGNKS